MKSIELTQSQIQAKDTGATMFMLPINKKHPSSYVIRPKDAPIQVDDKDIFVKEEFFEYEDIKTQYFTYSRAVKRPASQMTKEQSWNNFEKCVDVKIVNPKDICGNDKANIIGQEDYLGYIEDKFEEFYNQQMKEQNLDRTYQDNDYVFLIEFK